MTDHTILNLGGRKDFIRLVGKDPRRLNSNCKIVQGSCLRRRRTLQNQKEAARAGLKETSNKLGHANCGESSDVGRGAHFVQSIASKEGRQLQRSVSYKRIE